MQITAFSPNSCLSSTDVTLLACILHLEHCRTRSAILEAREVALVECSNRSALTSFVIRFPQKMFLYYSLCGQSQSLALERSLVIENVGKKVPCLLPFSPGHIGHKSPLVAPHCICMTRAGSRLILLPCSVGQSTRLFVCPLQKVCSGKRQPLSSPMLTQIFRANPGLFLSLGCGELTA